MPENDQPKTVKTVQSKTVPSDPAGPRRQRYIRSPSQVACVSLTPVRLEVLRCLAELRFLSLPQIARLCCPSSRNDLSEKSARRHMRALFDAALVDVLPVSRAALASPGTPDDASLLYGSAPNVYAPTARGLDTLYRAGLAERPDSGRKKPGYGPRNGLFLAHELAVRDVRVWLERAARGGGHEIERWQDGEAAAIGLDRGQAPFAVRPDAWFALRLGKAVLVGLVEVDRGTERGDRRWGEKLDAYAALFAGGRLPAVTGYVNARVLVLTPDARRRDALAGLLAERARKAGAPEIAGRFWLAEQAALEGAELTAPAWRRPGGDGLRPLVMAGALTQAVP